MPGQTANAALMLFRGPVLAQHIKLHSQPRRGKHPPLQGRRPQLKKAALQNS